MLSAVVCEEERTGFLRSRDEARVCVKAAKAKHAAMNDHRLHDGDHDHSTDAEAGP